MEWTENIVGKGENAGYQHFHLFPQCFQKSSFSGSLKVETCVVTYKPYRHFQTKNLTPVLAIVGLLLQGSGLTRKPGF